MHMVASTCRLILINGSHLNIVLCETVMRRGVQVHMLVSFICSKTVCVKCFIGWKLHYLTV